MTNPNTALVVPDWPLPAIEALEHVRRALGTWRSDAAQRRKIAEALVIDGEVSAKAAIEATKETNLLLKEIDAKRKATTEDLRLFVGAINDLVRPAADDLKAAKDAYTAKLTRYQREQERIAEAKRLEADREAKRLEEEASKQFDSGQEIAAMGTLQRAEDTQAEGTAAARIASGPLRAEGATGSMTARWKAEITSPGEVPRSYLCPDMDKINALRFEKPRPPDIPGVRWVDVSKVVVR